MAMSVGSDDNEEGSIASINTTPLVDVMLVLLIIFLITVPVIKKMAQVDIPKAVKHSDPDQAREHHRSVDTAGKIYWNASRIDDMQLFFQKIVGEARKSPQPEFHIRGDKSARWESIGRVIFNLQRGGIVKVGFITEPDRASIRVTR
jgi:biopolymer transport protein ExbD